MQLVPNANEAASWWSVRFMALAIAAQTAWETLPPDVLAVIPTDWQGRITLALTILALISRVIKQEPQQ